LKAKKRNGNERKIKKMKSVSLLLPSTEPFFLPFIFGPRSGGETKKNGKKIFVFLKKR